MIFNWIVHHDDHNICIQNPDIVLVHYLNVPYPDDAKLLVVASVSLWAERKEWSKDELISQLRPMCKSINSYIKYSFFTYFILLYYMCTLVY